MTTNDGRFQQFQSSAEHLVLGSAVSSGLRVPLAWIDGRQIEIQNRWGALRIRSLSTMAKVTFQGNLVTEDWVILPTMCEISVRGAGGQKMTISLRAASSNVMAVLANPVAGGQSSSRMYTGATIASLDGQALDEQVLELPPVAAAHRAVTVPSPAHRRLTVAIVAASFVVVLVPLGMLIYVAHRESQQRTQRSLAFNQLHTLMTKAEQQIGDRQYAEAKATLKDAEDLARSTKSSSELDEIQETMRRPEIQFGANGFQYMHEKWVEPAVAVAWLDAEQQYGRRIEQLRADANAQLASAHFAEARLSCAEAMAMMDHYPDAVKPHQYLAEFKEIDEKAKNSSVVRK